MWTIGPSPVAHIEKNCSGEFLGVGDFPVPKRILNAGEGENKFETSQIIAILLCVIGAFVLLGLSLNPSGRINVAA